MLNSKMSLLLFKEIINDQTNIRIDAKNRIFYNGLFLGRLEVKLFKGEHK